MAWTVEFLPAAEKELRKIARPVRERLLVFLRDRVQRGDDPRRHGEPLRVLESRFLKGHYEKGSELGKYWKYRVGDYRMICSIQDDRLVVVIVRISHRREAYR